MRRSREQEGAGHSRQPSDLGRRRQTDAERTSNAGCTRAWSNKSEQGMPSRTSRTKAEAGEDIALEHGQANR